MTYPPHNSTQNHIQFKSNQANPGQTYHTIPYQIKSNQIKSKEFTQRTKENATLPKIQEYQGKSHLPPPARMGSSLSCLSCFSKPTITPSNSVTSTWKCFYRVHHISRAVGTVEVCIYSSNLYIHLNLFLCIYTLPTVSLISYTPVFFFLFLGRA